MPPTTQLQPGASGDSVKALQSYLVKGGYLTQAQMDTGPGIYGPQTTAAVAAMQKALGVDNSTGVGYYGPRTISAVTLQGQQQPLAVPPPPVPTPPVPAALDTLMANRNAPTPEETKVRADQTDILSRIRETLGFNSAAERMKLEAEAGVPEKQAQLDQYFAQINAINSSAFQATQDSEGRLAPTFAIYGEQAQIQRQKAAQTYGLAAAAAALDTQIGRAQTYINQAIEVEFADRENELKYQTLVYQDNKEALKAIDQRKAELLEVQLAERSRLLAEEKADKEEIYKMALTAQKYGADPGTVQTIMEAKTREDALSAAGASLQDPMAKLELQQAQLDIRLKQLAIQKTQREISLIGQPSAADIKAQQEALKKAETAAPIIQDTIDTIDALKKHRGLDSTVGTNPFARTAFTDEFTGQKQDFIATVEQLTNQATLNQLTELKAAGGTLGAVNTKEFDTLRNSATKINNWAIIRNDKVIGYNTTERAFVEELDKIKTARQRLLHSLQDTVLTSEEQAALDVLETDTIISGDSFY